ncbi:MAG: hypothetical protein Q8N26_07665 [Myxococcales bacterium]|nr:hypothetical protein [Myxococcales bacterium]
MATPPPTQAQLRPFRGAAWALYLVVAVGFSGLVIYSVTKSVFQMSPNRPAPATAKSVEVCVAGLTSLFDSLEAERQKLTAPRASEADRRWLTFRTGWMVRLRELEAECALEESERSELRVAFAGLHKVMDLSTVEATQVAGQLGPALDSFRQQLSALPGGSR